MNKFISDLKYHFNRLEEFESWLMNYGTYPDDIEPYLRGYAEAFDDIRGEYKRLIKVENPFNNT
jgi:hypothetical protein